MGNELVGDSFSTETKSCKETFEEVFPFYLSEGMTYEQFYKGDVELVIAYRKAYERKRKEKNFDLWLQGLYIYDAVSTVIYNAWGDRKGQEPLKYTQDPYNLFLDDEIEEKKTELAEQEQKARAEAWLSAFVQNYSK